MFNVLEWNINYCQDLCALSGGTVHVVLYDAVVEDAVTFLQVVGLLTIYNLDLTLHHIDEFLALVSRKLEFRTVLRVDIDDERFMWRPAFCCASG